VTAALGFGVVVVACLTDPAGACGATPRAIGLCAPLWHSEVGDDEGFLSVAQYGEAPAVRRGGGAALVRRAEAEGGGDVEGGVAFKLVAVWLDAKPDKVNHKRTFEVCFVSLSLADVSRQATPMHMAWKN
jgi:hypothetical protein